MKKALILTAAAFALCACFKVEEDQVLTEILFDAAAYKSTTKAGPLEGANYGYDCPEFTVYLSYLAPNSTWATGHTNSKSYAKATCSADQTNEIWTSDPVTYWPLNGSLTFVGFSPASVESAFDNTTAKLTCNYDIADQDDIMFSAAKDAADLTADAYKAENYTPDGTTNAKSTTGVPIIFRHALSQVIVKVQADPSLNEDIKFNVTSLSFAEKASGALTVIQTAEPAVTWNLSGEVVKHSILSANTEVKKGTTFTSDSDASKTGNQGILVFPQSTNEPKLVISYEQLQNSGSKDGSGNVIWTSGGIRENYEIPLSADEFTSFDPGKKYILTVTLSASRILYSPRVVEWDEVTPDKEIKL